MSYGNRSAGNTALAQQGEGADGSDQSASGNDAGGNSQTGAVAPIVEQASGPNEPVEGQPKTEGQEANPYNARDIVAQEAMADASIVMAIAATLTFFVTLAGTLLIWRQVKLTREAVEDTGEATKAMVRQNELTEKYGEAQVRCYLSHTGAQLGFTDDGTAVINCSVKNSGASPARGVSMLGEITIYNGQKLWVFDKSCPTVPNVRLDIGSSETEECSCYIETQIDDVLPHIETEGYEFMVSIKLFVTGEDVFGKPTSEKFNLVAFLNGGLRDQAWIEMKSTGEIDLTERPINDDSRHHEDG